MNLKSQVLRTGGYLKKSPAGLDLFFRRNNMKLVAEAEFKQTHKSRMQVEGTGKHQIREDGAWTWIVAAFAYM